jgi:hypothetical protein
MPHHGPQKKSLQKRLGPADEHFHIVIAASVGRAPARQAAKPPPEIYAISNVPMPPRLHNFSAPMQAIDVTHIRVAHRTDLQNSRFCLMEARISKTAHQNEQKFFGSFLQKRTLPYPTPANNRAASKAK